MVTVMTTSNKFTQFCTNVQQLFAQSHGNPSHESIRELLMKSNFVKEDWEKYAKFDPTVNYTRNPVYCGDDRGYNLLILCWNPGKGSPIHDHDESSCFLKVLEGDLEETKYEVPIRGEHLKLREKNVHTEGTLTYMDNSIGLHSVKNPSDTKEAVSLHLYFPPLTKCKTYDEAGQSSSCTITIINN